MSENLKDILSNLNPDIDQETLLNYLQVKLSAEQQHEVEKQMLQDDFGSEAMEGLQEIKDRKKNFLTGSPAKPGPEKENRKEKTFQE